MGLPKTFLALGISVVFVAFIAYGMNVVYEPPAYDSGSGCYLKYDCNKQMRECEKNYAVNATPGIVAIAPNDCYVNLTRAPEYKACMKEQQKCDEEYTRASPGYRHARNTFFIMLFIGLAAIIGGSAKQHLEGVGSGFIGGGVLVILWSIIQSGIYIYHLDRYVKLAGLGVALAVLVYIGYKRMDTTAGKTTKK